MLKIISELTKLPPRKENSHKGTYGRLLIIGGSPGMIGAPAFAGEAALRMGVGLVDVGTTKSELPFVLSLCPEMIGFVHSKKLLREHLYKAQAVVIGPGLGVSALAQESLLFLISTTSPLLIDADGLNILSRLKSWPKSFKAQAVLTPHPGEMARLCKSFKYKKSIESEKERIAASLFIAQATGQVIVLKGARTVVCDGERVFINTSGDSSLSKGGTGDVLSGMIGALLAQKIDSFEAACLGVYLHGLAGEKAGLKLGARSVLARDVIASISEVLNQFGDSALTFK